MKPVDVLNPFHPMIKEWFTGQIGIPSLPQIYGWPKIQEGKNVLISAPTGAGKTLAAFLGCIDHLLKIGLEDSLPEGVFILYVSPLKALNNDIYKNLEVPLEGVKKCFQHAGIPFPPVTKAVRTGDTPQNERQRMVKSPPHILITTPESLYLMLTSYKASRILQNIRYLIVDEIHTMLGTKRGVHLALSIERLENLAHCEIIRIGLSATVNPLETAASYLGGLKKTDDGYVMRSVSIVAPVMERRKDLSIQMPVADYRVLEQGTIWPEIYDCILKLVKQHTSTIVFVNNRAVAERVAANINSLADEDLCRPHHGSISKVKRFEVEEKFKNGELTCMIATSTLELGIDIGSVDLMIQVAAPISVSSGLQRLGRAGHRLDVISKGRIIPKTRGDLIKSAFISKEMLNGNIEEEKIPQNCLDILSQHIVSMCCDRKWSEDEMLDIIRCAWSYRNLKQDDYRKVLTMLSGDYEHLEDIPVKPRIQWNRHNKTVEGTGYSRMLAINSSGTIPDRGYFSVVLEDYKTRIGELDEVFVFEARLGDRFMLGNSAWKMVKIEKNRVVVAPGNRLGAKTPFWQGDGFGCPFKQGLSYGRFLKELSDRLDSEDFLSYLATSTVLDDTAALNIRNYLLDQRDVIGCLSHDHRVVVEYFKEEVTDQQIIIHAHFGGRVNSVLAILMQKVLEETLRCQVFTSHSNDAILVHIYGCPDVLSNILAMLEPSTVESTLLQMLPSTSRFAMTFRYNAYRALMMGVRNLGQRLPLWIQRLRSVDALENARKYMDHPLIIETMRECLEEIFDLPNTIQVLKEIKSGHIEVFEKNTWFPSPFATELLFEFKSVMMYAEKAPHPGDNNRLVISGINALNLSYHQDESNVPMDEKAVQEAVMKNSAPSKLMNVLSLNELHSFLLIYGDITCDEIPSSNVQNWIKQLLEEKRVLMIKGSEYQTGLYIALEELALYESAIGSDFVEIPKEIFKAHHSMEPWLEEEAIFRIVRRFARYHSPFSMDKLKKRYRMDGQKIIQVLTRLESEGLLVKKQFTHYDRNQNTHYDGNQDPNRDENEYRDDNENHDKNKCNDENEYCDVDEYCHVKVYEAIIRKESALRANEVIAQPPPVYASFLQSWQKIGAPVINQEMSLYEVIRQLEGLYLPLDWWESMVFPARIKGYSPSSLDRICASGKVFWRVSPECTDKKLSLAWYCIDTLTSGMELIPESDAGFTPQEELVYQVLKQRGACFTHVLSTLSGISSSDLLGILETLVYKGFVVNDSFIAIRYFINNSHSSKRDLGMNTIQKARRIAHVIARMDMGRWEIAWPVLENDIQQLIDRWFSRYGLLCREIVSMESTSISWNKVYEALKVREYAGNVLRGYFIQGISGIQFMLPEACQKLSTLPDIQVINACDPAQAYGKILSHSESLLPFTDIPGTVIVTMNGKQVVVLERFGERIQFSANQSDLTMAIQAFKEAFTEKRVWADQKKIVVKFWPEDAMEKGILQTALLHVGFQREVMKLVLWR